MRWTNVIVVALTLVSGLSVTIAHAQRGLGDPAGVARQGSRTEAVTVVGEVLKVDTAPCENTTGRALLGSHVLIRTSEGETRNVHLGPATRVQRLAADLSPGTRVRVEGFRTEPMQAGHCVAMSVAYGDRTVTLRNENLRPVWTGAQGANAATGGSARGGRGQGRPAGGLQQGGLQQGGLQQGGLQQGAGFQRGPGYGRGAGMAGGGQGQGCPAGGGCQQGGLQQGAGLQQGPGYGRGAGMAGGGQGQGSPAGGGLQQGGLQQGAGLQQGPGYGRGAGMGQGSGNGRGNGGGGNRGGRGR